MLLLVVESKSGYMIPVQLMEHAKKNPQEVLQAFADAWKMQACYPKEIRCRDERTYALLKDFCEKTDVKVSIYKKKMMPESFLEELRMLMAHDVLPTDIKRELEEKLKGI